MWLRHKKLCFYARFILNVGQCATTTNELLEIL